MKKQQKSDKKIIKKVSFFHLFKIFKWQLIIYWLTSIVIVTISCSLLSSAHKLVDSGSNIENYASILLPRVLENLFGNPMWKKETFLLFLTILITLQIFLLYLSNLQKKKFQIEGEYYVKDCLLEKFSHLPFEERERRKKEISTLSQEDSAIIGKFWNDLYNSIFRWIITLFLTIGIFKFFTVRGEKMNRETIFVSLIWLFLINLVSYFFLRVILQNEKKYKQELTKENALINKESDKSILIDSMGLTSQFQDRRRSKAKKNQTLFKYFARITSLYEIIPTEIINYYPFIILIFVKRFSATSLYTFYYSFHTFSDSFSTLMDYGNYSSSLTRINNFLSLPEKNDNLSGLIITKKINSIVFKNVYFKHSKKSSQILKNHDDDFTKKNVSYLLGESDTDKGTIVYFKYATGENWVLEDYNHNFTTGKINELSGENGTGKSTILYLLLGMLQPTDGQVLINCQGGKIYDLHQDINLKHWREQIVAYCAHDTLIEEGSTGQKQLTNVEQVITEKKEAQIFCFDEADNALDKKNQEEFEEQLKSLLKKNKLVIYTTKV